jgi:hypothetical protein
MARLRPESTRRPVVVPEVPLVLQRWFVDDWVSLDDPVDLTWVNRFDQSDKQATISQLVLRSRQLFLAARNEWSKELRSQGIEPPFLSAVGGPRWRNPRGASTQPSPATKENPR